MCLCLCRYVWEHIIFVLVRRLDFRFIQAGRHSFVRQHTVNYQTMQKTTSSTSVAVIHAAVVFFACLCAHNVPFSGHETFGLGFAEWCQLILSRSSRSTIRWAHNAQAHKLCREHTHSLDGWISALVLHCGTRKFLQQKWNESIHSRQH